MDPVRVLVVDDEASLVDVVGRYLSREGFEVVTAGDGERAVELARRHRPDVIVLDLMLPGIDGLEVARRVRSFSDAYLIMLTAKAEEIDRIVGLSVGADDYLTKPFSPRELVARVHAMLRRPRTAEPSGAEPHDRRVGRLMIDSAAREVLVDGEPVELTKLEFDLLGALARHPGVVLSRGQILQQVWGSDHYDDHVVAVHVANLRRKLGDDPGAPVFIRTVRGVGYRLGPGT